MLLYQSQNAKFKCTQIFKMLELHLWLKNMQKRKIFRLMACTFQNYCIYKGKCQCHRVTGFPSPPHIYTLWIYVLLWMVNKSGFLNQFYFLKRNLLCYMILHRTIKSSTKGTTEDLFSKRVCLNLERLRTFKNTVIHIKLTYI